MSQYPHDPLRQDAAPGTPEVPEAALPVSADADSAVEHAPVAVVIDESPADSLSVSELAMVSNETEVVVPSSGENVDEQADPAEQPEGETPAEVPAEQDATPKPAFLGDAANFVAPAKSAAAEAAEFVARIFADVQGKDSKE